MEGNMQSRAHPEGFDYRNGSPHLLHATIYEPIIKILRDEVNACLARSGRAQVLEVGAGHGSFTDHILALGATVTCTEMSHASVDLLRARYAHNDRARVILDEDGSGEAIAQEEFDVVVCMSVLHHIPDYQSAISKFADRLSPHGAFLSFQDPLWYPRRSRANLLFDRASYFIWRLGEGDYVEGARTLRRRLSGNYDEQNWRDMSEYHVVRQGVDECAIQALLAPRFRNVNLLTYWSAQSALMQRIGERLRTASTFAVIATDRL